MNKIINLFKCSKGFVLVPDGKVDYTIISYEYEGGLSYGDFYDLEEVQEFEKEKEFVAKFDLQSSEFRFEELENVIHLFYGEVDFFVVPGTRTLTCKYYDRMYHTPITTPRWTWEANNPGPYREVNLFDDRNPFSDMDWVFWNGLFKLSDPPIVTLVIPLNYLEDFTKLALDRGQKWYRLF